MEEVPVIACFYVFCIQIRSMRPDRTVVASARAIDQILDPKYTEPVTDSVESIWQESSSRVPVVFLLSPGTDPTSSIDDLAKKKRKFPTDKVSMGEGQEVVAREKIKSGLLSGSWVILQNCHLGLNFMNEIEELLLRVTDINKVRLLGKNLLPLEAKKECMQKKRLPAQHDADVMPF